MRIFIIGPVLVVAGCGSDIATPFVITHDVCEPIVVRTPEATPAQRTGIDDAIALWAPRGVRMLSQVTDPGITPDVEIVFDSAAPMFHGLYDDTASRIYINNDLVKPEMLAVVIAHELGHAFSLFHVSGRASVMNSGNLVNTPNAEDQLALEAAWGVCDTITNGASYSVRK